MNNYLLEYKLQEKQGHKWVTVEHYTEQATEEQLSNCVCKETLRWFRNLGGIENEIYERTNQTLTVLMDRLSIYIHDYFIVDFSEQVNVSLDRLNDLSYKEMSIVARRIKDKDSRKFYRRLFIALDRPDIFFIL